ncbi:hypothetical protein P280DRAFT_13122 [Massarina eburnea CBS 473.64]|uniref:Mid2 domain-containing protein n=1 Tax=Massarina eburnea CBS 473.64 TaxID=1395130 RepID=A0A6A6SG71_9PLEO|nr:hypothetical protein P280DRAFT_13122 [Massarina eburnea CBS 473.64]
MIRTAVLAVALLGLERVAADYNQFYFPTNSTQFRCSGMGNVCPPPSVCAHDALTDVHYCCGTGSKDAVCWTNSQSCRGDDAQPASGQLGCPSNAGPNTYCCRSGREQCTQRSGQINICWATSMNEIANASSDSVNATYSSISSASASAKTLTVNLAALTSTSVSTTPTSVDASQTPSSSSTDVAAASNTASGSPDNGSSKISGGAIGGIVAGAVVGVALLAAGGFMLFRRNKAKQGSVKSELDNDNNNTGNPYTGNGYSAVANGPPQTKYAHNPGPAMMPGDEQHMQYAPVEMPTNAYQHELEGTYGAKREPVSQLP